MMSQAIRGGLRPDDGIEPGGMLLHVDNISLSFGGVKAISDISFDILP